MRFCRWDSRTTSEETNSLLKELAFWHLGQCDQENRDVTNVKQYLLDDNWRAICDVDVDYNTIDTNTALHLRQALAFFQKRKDLPIDVDRRAVALETFQRAEELCRETNDIFKKWSHGGFLFPRDVEQVLFLAQRKISAILGDVPELSALKPHFGPGATTQVRKRNASTRRKLSQVHACSEEFLASITECLEELQGWLPEGNDTASVPVEIHPGKLNFVPKSAKTDRIVVVEPMLNTMFQLGICDYMTGKLKRFGVDLSDQTKNQRLALRGSIDGSLATLDLSSASDCIAYELIYHMLPIDWALFLDKFRTGTILVKGKTLKLQKFSSMGNGFTFPLESLLFYSLAIACCSEDEKDQVSVYGDDIIIPAHRYDLLTKVLRCIGFMPNAKKSFASGPFRESCGKDFLSGIDIRPCYIKEPLAGEDIFRLHNFYVRGYLEEPATYLKNLIDPSIRIFGPDGYGDGHLIGAYQPKPFRREDGWSGYIFETFTWSVRKSFNRTMPGDKVLPSYTIYANPPEEGIAGVDNSIFDLLVRQAGLTRKGRDTIAKHYNVCPSALSYRPDKDGNLILGVPVPGRGRKCKLISIYTLLPHPAR